MSVAAKEAYYRFRFKQRVCLKRCGLHNSKGGFCLAKREQIDYCLSLEKAEEDNRNYRNLENVVEWIEVFAEEKGMIMFQPSKDAIDVAKKLLETTRLDCYDIAERVMSHAV